MAPKVLQVKFRKPQRFRLSDGVAYAFLENSRLYRTDRRLSVADGTQGSDCSECGRDMSRTCP